MTPKEKAEELYNNYLSTVRFTMEDCSWSYRGDAWELCVKKTAKWSSLIAVEFALEQVDGTLDEIFDKILYLTEVKIEIEEL